MLLQNKIAIVYGAGGSLGGAVAKALSAAGAKLFLAGRNIASVQKVADEVLAAGGNVQADVVDAMDEQAIKQHINGIVSQYGTIDISFNAAAEDLVQGLPLINMAVDDFMQPIKLMLQTQFLTATAAGRVMAKQGNGVILTLTATPGGIVYPYTAGFAPACTALECFSKNLASEIGIYGVRVVNIRSAGSPDSRVFKEAIDGNPEMMADVLDKMKKDTMLRELPAMEDIANVAVFLSSNLASKITGVTVDVTCGTTSGLNYRAMADNQIKHLGAK